MNVGLSEWSGYLSRSMDPRRKSATKFGLGGRLRFPIRECNIQPVKDR